MSRFIVEQPEHNKKERLSSKKNCMISIFNGRTRELGKSERKDVFIQVSVSLREHLHLYRTGEGIKNPGGYARSIHNSGVADPQMKKFFNDIELEPSIVQNNKSCHRCQGTGFYYPEDLRAGVSKCLHEDQGGINEN
jgi:hypothetical protein